MCDFLKQSLINKEAVWICSSKVTSMNRDQEFGCFRIIIIIIDAVGLDECVIILGYKICCFLFSDFKKDSSPGRWSKKIFGGGGGREAAR